MRRIADIQSLTDRASVASSPPRRRAENGLHMLCQVELTPPLDF